MEGEIFAEDILGGNRSPLQTDKPMMKLTNSVHQIPDATKPRKPWEQVRFDPELKPKDYQIKGMDF
jgi:hypothetical protein